MASPSFLEGATETVWVASWLLLARGTDAVYSSIRHSITQSYTQTVRQWLSTQSYEAQREFGLLAIENVRKGFW